jgi:hypothetical protein
MKIKKSSSEAVGWFLGAVIILLALFDAFAWVTFQNAPAAASDWLLVKAADPTMSAPQN